MKNKIEEPKIGGHYYDSESLKYLYCYYSLMIVLDKSEKAKELFEEVKKCCELPGCRQLIDGVLKRVQNPGKFFMDFCYASGLDPTEDRTMNLKDTKVAIPGIRKVILSYIFREKIKLFFNPRKQNDSKKLKKSVDDFITIGFNKESDRANGKYKIMAKSSKTLVETTYIYSLVEAKKFSLGILTDFAKLPAVTIGKNTYTFEELINNKAPKRTHNKLVDEYQNAGFGLKNEELIARNA